MANILLIDDNEQLRNAASRAFVVWGHDVVTAKNGEEGLRRALEGDFDVIVCDLEMPGLSGDQVFAQLPPEMQERFILHTAHVFAEDKFGMLMRVHDKSQHPSELRNVLERIPQRRGF